MTTNINSAIYDSLSAICTTYPVCAISTDDDPVTLPFVTYQRNSFAPMYSKSLFTGIVEHGYEVNIADANYSNTLTLAEAVINAMLALTSRQPVGASFKFDQVRLNGMSEYFDDNGFYVQNLSFTINTKEI